MRLRAALVALLALVAPAASIAAQGVLVAPQGVAIDHRVRSGSFEVYNPGTERVEVAVATIFGYPVSDSTGRTTLLTLDAPDSTAPSAAKWITAYPRRLVLGPGERQTIRLFARPPQALADGEYWTRVVVAARKAGGGDAAADTVVRAGIALEVRTIIAAWYRKGSLATGLAVDSVPAARVAGDSIIVRPWLRRTGSAAYIGTLNAALVDSSGRTVAKVKQQLAVYTALSPRLALGAPARLAPGRYVVRLDINDDREDLRREQRVPAPPVSRTIELVVPAAASRATPTGS